MNDAGRIVGLGLFIVMIIAAPIYWVAKKRRRTAGSALYLKLAIGGFLGLACAVLILRSIAQNNLGNSSYQTSRERPLRTPEQADRQSAEEARLENEKRLQQVRELREAQRIQTREQRESAMQQKREQREALLAQQRAEDELKRDQARAVREAELAAAAASGQQGLDRLNSMSLSELNMERDARKAEVDQASAAMRAASAAGASHEERRAASKRHSAALKAYMDASKALAEKKRQQR